MSIRRFVSLVCAAAVLGCGGSSGGGGKNGKPTVTITSPQEGASVAPGAVFVLAASASDPEDGDLSASVAWSDDKGDLTAVSGATASVSLSTAGAHQITASVADKAGNPATAHVTVNVSADVPIVTITEPAPGAHVHPGAVHLAGTAVDSDATPLSSQIQWTDSVETISLQGAAVDAQLSQPGTHIITAKVTGAHGTGQAQVSIVLVANDPPSLIVSSPEDVAYYKVNTAVTLSAEAGDLEDCANSSTWCLTGSIQWTVTPPGGGAPVTHTGGASSFTPTATGDYTVAASITDSGAAATIVTVLVHVVNNPPPLCVISVVNPQVPANPNFAYAGTTVGFAGNCGAVTSDKFTWSVDPTVSGSIVAHGNFTLPSLAAGSYTVGLCVSNENAGPGDPAQGCTGFDLTVVENAPPTICNILAPGEGGSVAMGQNFDLVFTANDPQDPALTQTPLKYTVSMSGINIPGLTDLDVVGDPTTVSVLAGGSTSAGRVFAVTLTDSAGVHQSCSVTLAVQ